MRLDCNAFGLNLVAVEPIKPDIKRFALNAFTRALPYIVFLAAISILALQKHLLTVCVKYAENLKPENLPDPGLWLIVPAAVCAGLASAIPAALKVRLPVSVGIQIAVFATGAASCNVLWLWLALPVGTIVWRLTGWLKRNAGPREGLFAVALLALILAWGAELRYRYMVDIAFKDRETKQGIQSDAEFFRQIATTQHGYDTLSREPLFPWLAKTVILLNGNIPPQAMRLFGAALSFITIGVIFWFCHRYIGLLAAIIATVLYSITFPFVHSGVQGLREDTINSTFILFIAACIEVWNRKPDLWNCIFMGVTGALTSLIRLNNLFMVLAGVVVFCTASIVRHKVPRRQWWLAAVAFMLAFGPVLPYLIYCKQKFGDSMYAVNNHTRFYANSEFAGRRPDFPTREQFLKNGYEGSRMTMGQYILDYHTMDEIIRRTWRGGVDVYLGKYPQQLTYQMMWPGQWGAIFYLPHLLGLAAMFLPGRRIAFTYLFLFTLPSLFLVGTAPLDWRLLTTAFAGFYIGVGAAAQTIWTFATTWSDRLKGRFGQSGNQRHTSTLERPPRRRSRGKKSRA